MRTTAWLLFALLLPVTACNRPSATATRATPVTAATPATTAMRAALAWQEAHPIAAKAPTDWTNGAYYTGVARAHAATGAPAFLDAIRAMATRNDYQPWERTFHADDIAIAYAYLYLDEQEPGTVDLAPTSAWIDAHLHADHAWKRGDTTTEQRILWWWCDALFMAPPVLVEYAAQTDQPALLGETYTYYRQTYDLLFDPTEQLFARDTRYQWTGSPDDRKEPNGKKIFWSRGNGWVLGGLALILDDRPEVSPHRDFYLGLYRTMAARVLALQPADGLWRPSLLDPDQYNHGEVSGSGFYTFALAWGINRGILDRATYGPAVRKAWRGLRAAQQPDGKVGWVQNIGADPQPATADSWQNYGTGAFLLAGSEVIRLDP